MHHGLAVEKLHDAGLDRRGSIVREYDRATIMSQRSLNTIDIADLPGRSRAASA